MIELAQNINEVGTLVVSTEKNVIFKKRTIKNIYIVEDDVCTIEIYKNADEGNLAQTVSLPFSIFSNAVEDQLWKLIDQALEGKG